MQAAAPVRAPVVQVQVQVQVALRGPVAAQAPVDRPVRAQVPEVVAALTRNEVVRERRARAV